MTTIEEITLRTILDSRGNETVEAEIHTRWGFGRAAAPSGASTGTYEARVRPPRQAIEDAEKNLIPSLIGEDARDQITFDARLREIDGTPNFSSIGANIAVALSLACAKAAASSLDLELFRYLGGVFADKTPLPWATSSAEARTRRAPRPSRNSWWFPPALPAHRRESS